MLAAAGPVLRLPSAHGGSDPSGPLFPVLAAPDPGALALVVVPGLLYALGVARLRRRGDAWGPGRVVAFALGLLVLAVALLSGLAAYEDDLFGVHMLQHMLLTMVAPVLLALGAPVTLALRTLPPPGRRALLAVLHSRAVRVLSFPLLPWLLFVGSPFALYFTGWYEATLTSGAWHALLHVHFLAVGCAFFWPLLGVDPVPGRVTHPLRMLLLVTTLPFHAFLGIAVMSVQEDGSGLLAADHYLARHPLAEAVDQQELGGALLWASGDVVALLFLLTVLVQWMRASEREAVREDRRLDRLEAAQAPAPGSPG